MTFLDRGHERRRWLNTSLGGLLDYYIGPTGIPDRLRAVNQLFNPINDLSESMASAREASKGGLTMYERAPHMLNSLTSGTAFAAPMIAGGAVATRNADDIARYLEDAFTGVSMQAQGASDAGRRFAADEYGGIKAYHGSPHDFDEFRTNSLGQNFDNSASKRGLWFTTSKDEAEFYGDKIYEVELSGKYADLPSMPEMGDETLGFLRRLDSPAAMEYVDYVEATHAPHHYTNSAASRIAKSKREGFDGAKLAGGEPIAGIDEVGDHYVVFDENLIKVVKKYGIAGAAAMLGVSAEEVQAAISDPGQGGAQ